METSKPQSLLVMSDAADDTALGRDAYWEQEECVCIISYSVLIFTAVLDSLLHRTAIRYLRLAILPLNKQSQEHLRSRKGNPERSSVYVFCSESLMYSLSAFSYAFVLLMLYTPTSMFTTRFPHNCRIVCCSLFR